MPFDGVALRAVAAELQEKIIGGRVEKVNQPERDEIHLIIRNNYQNYKLLVSSTANYPRVHLTQINKPNPDKAPMFCMLLRKHLTGGKVLSVNQVGMERILDISFGVIDELGLAGEVTLHIEIMGRHSNAILVDASGTIIDSIKRVTEEKSRVREVLPGLPYSWPPSQGKQDPMVMQEDGWLALVQGSTDKPMWQALCEGLCGLSHPTAKELLSLCAVNPLLASSEIDQTDQARLSASLSGLFANFREGRFEPVVLESNGQALDFLPFQDSMHRGRRCATISAAAEAFYAQRDLRERLKQNSANMTHVLNTALNRAKKKLEKQAEGFTESSGLEIYRLKGELLTANLHTVQKGLKAVEVQNYYAEDSGMLAIELNPMLSPSENAQHYYKKYAKAKSALENLKMQIEATQIEISYLESQLSNIEISSTETELDEIRQELAGQGFLKDAAAKSRKRVEPGKPHHYLSGDGFDIYVGRNNTQNDALTLKFARNDDIWMHTKEIPGSHVIIKAVNGAVSDEALTAGAMLAAWYSKARSSSSVPVDYTARRNVKKPSGARPGYVIYLTNKTITVTPDESKVNNLKKQK